jgi:hypothetical protein
VSVAGDRRRTLVHEPSAPSFQSHVPLGLTVVEGKTAHHVSACFHTFDCGLSMVECETGIEETCVNVAWPGAANASASGKPSRASNTPAVARRDALDLIRIDDKSVPFRSDESRRAKYVCYIPLGVLERSELSVPRSAHHPVTAVTPV